MGHSPGGPGHRPLPQCENATVASSRPMLHGAWGTHRAPWTCEVRPIILKKNPTMIQRISQVVQSCKSWALRGAGGGVLARHIDTHIHTRTTEAFQAKAKPQKQPKNKQKPKHARKPQNLSKEPGVLANISLKTLCPIV